MMSGQDVFNELIMVLTYIEKLEAEYLKLKKDNEKLKEYLGAAREQVKELRYLIDGRKPGKKI